MHFFLFLAAFAISWTSQSGTRTQRVWLALPEFLAEHAGADLHHCIVGLSVVAALCALAGALLRTWGAAYLGSDAVWGMRLRSEGLITNGPYRYVRNPVYLGTMLHTLALTVLFSWVGAVFALVTVVGLQLVLVAAEERYLANRLGEAYELYCKQVRRFLPRFGGGAAASRTGGAWLPGFRGEVYPWGVALTFAVLGSRYNALLIVQGLLVSLGLAILARGVSQR